jgi:hypothetical protein
MRRRKRYDRSFRPVLAMFLFGLFMVLGISPGSLIFDTVVGSLTPYVQYAALIGLLVMLYLLYGNVLSPLIRMFHAYRTCGILGVIALVLAFLGGIYIFIEWHGLAYLIASMVLWKISTKL